MSVLKSILDGTANFVTSRTFDKSGEKQVTTVTIDADKIPLEDFATLKKEVKKIKKNRYHISVNIRN